MFFHLFLQAVSDRDFQSCFCHCLENVVDHLTKSRLVVSSTGYDRPIDQQQFLGHETVSLQESKLLPVQPAREFGQDTVMGNGGDDSTSSSR